METTIIKKTVKQLCLFLIVILTVIIMTKTGVSQTATPNPVCYGDPINLICNLPGCGTPGAVYDWTNLSGTWTSNLENPVILPNTTGYASDKFYLSVVYSPPPGGFSGGRVNVTVLPQFIAGIASANQSICSGTAPSPLSVTAPTGGKTPYSYQWQHSSDNQTFTNIVGANGLTYSPGVLNVTTYYRQLQTSSNSCGTLVTNTVIITVNPVLPVSVSIVASANPVCAGSSVTFTATPVNGGTSPSYQWKVNGAAVNGATGSSYNYVPVNGDVVACVLNSNVTCQTGNPATSNAITMALDMLTISNSAIQNVTCNGGANGSISITITGGFQPYYYLWSNGATTPQISNLEAGNYHVTVTDANGCTAVSTWTITQPDPLLLLSNVTVKCSLSSVDITTSGGVPAYTFSWSDGPATEDRAYIPAGTYTLTVTDMHSCQAVESIVVTTNDCKDFGDLPENDNLYLHYNTTIQNNGARANILPDPNHTIRLGWVVDSENNGIPDNAAKGDDLNPTGGEFDEDGLGGFTVLPCNGSPGNINILVANTSGSDAYLQGWIDFDHDGDFTEPDEHVITDEPIQSTTVFSPIYKTYYTCNPDLTTTFLKHAARFRLSDRMNVNYDNPPNSEIPFGEVEDYFSEPFPAIHDLPIYDTICIADTTNLYPIVEIQGGTPPYHYHWTSVPPGFNSYLQNPVALPMQTTTYKLVVTDANGMVTSGETHAVTDSCDYGDAPDNSIPINCNFNTTNQENGAMHLKKAGGSGFLGSRIDYEINGIPHTSALGDDHIPLMSDDEDGVVPSNQPCLIGSYCEKIHANAAGYLNSWIDFDLSGTWDLPNEHVYKNVFLNAGDNYLSFTIPPQSLADSTFARYRFTVSPMDFPSPDGYINHGEVEDHKILVGEPYDGGGSHHCQLHIVKKRNVSCYGGFDGEVELSASGGVPPYSYLWSTGSISQNQNALAAGQYSVTVTDFNGQAAHESLTIFEFPAQIANAGPDQLNIPDTMITLQGTRQHNGIGMWSILSGTGGFIEDVFNPYSNFHGLVGQNYILRWTITTNCGSSADDAEITFVNANFDYGDAPAPYHSTYAANGPHHRISPNMRLGDLIDSETDAVVIPSNAMGDDNDGAADEDGVQIPPLKGGQLNTIIIKTYLAAGSSAYLQGWIDFNHDGDWTFPGEQILTNYPVTVGSVTFPVSFFAPACSTNYTTYARFRISTAQSIGPDGIGKIDGEVEDYQVHVSDSIVRDSICAGNTITMNPTISGGTPPYIFSWSSFPMGFVSDLSNPVVSPLVPTYYTAAITDAVGQVTHFTRYVIPFPCDYGDAPDECLPADDLNTLTKNDGARHIYNPEIRLGPTIDQEPDGQPALLADRDDASNQDEDGITQKGGKKLFSLVKGPNTVQVTALSVITHVGYLNAWIDFNQNHQWDNDEMVLTDYLINPANQTTINVNLDVPLTGPAHYFTYARFRFTDYPVGGAQPLGMEKNGEVEDYFIRIDSTNEVTDSIDLWAQDDKLDVGDEPNTNSSFLYISDDIWVRYSPDNSPQPTHLPHLNPEFGQPNYVHVQVRNRGTHASIAGANTVEVYWSDASTALGWPGDFLPAGGGMIGSAVIPASIPPGGSLRVLLPGTWSPPKTGHYCLLARICPVQTYTPASAPSWEYVVRNNNVIQKNVIVVDNIPGKFSVKVGKKTVDPNPVTFYAIVPPVIPPTEDSSTIFQVATVKLKLEDSLYQIWEQGGKQGSNILELSDSSLQILNHGAYITNLNLEANSKYSMFMSFDRNTPLPGISTAQSEYNLDIQQFSMGSNNMEGGVRFSLNQCFLNPVIITLTETNPACSGSAVGSIQLNTSGGTAPFTYLWNTGATTQHISQLSAGVYTVTVTDANGCRQTAGKTLIAEPPVPVNISITASANPIFDGTLVTFTATPVNGGTIPPKFNWKKNGLVIPEATLPTFCYAPMDGDVITCMLTSNVNCATNNPATSNAVIMAVNPVVGPVLNVTNVSVENNQAFCYNATNTIMVAGSPTTFVVNDGGSATFIAGQKILFKTGTRVFAGGYMHGYISTQYCGMAPSLPMVAVVSGNLEPFKSSQIHFLLYPNPTTGAFTLIQKGDQPLAQARVELYSMRGEKLMTENMMGEQKHEFRLPNIPDGLYFVKVVAEGYAETIKLIKIR